MSINDYDNKGYLFDVNIEYPKELHDKHNDYPLLPERKLILTKMLSSYQIEIKNKLNIKDDIVPKLVSDLTDKTNYRLHYKILQLCIQLGLKVKNINKILSFKQDDWLKDYIEGNSKLRQEAKLKGDGFLANLYKIMNNSVYGKQMENVRNRCDIRLVKDKTNKYVKLISHPLYKFKRTIFNENLVAVHMN